MKDLKIYLYDFRGNDYKDETTESIIRYWYSNGIKLNQGDRILSGNEYFIQSITYSLGSIHIILE